ncbi:tape measure protein [Limosilactobacillus oris]|uniref:tape measure protein n=1 Tax=Limosilactobacillus oris TaxID=1632 RepID=UPI0018837FFE|nr:tape measure protein [Limosilactobacillus oris]MBF0601900.1 lytic transglycosylase [Limosilactobacillus oris]
MSSVVAEKKFVWKFQDEVTNGVAKARQAIQDTQKMIHEFQSMSFNGGANFARQAAESARKATADATEAKRSIIDSASETANSVTEKVSQATTKQSSLAKEAIEKIREKNAELQHNVKQTVADFMKELTRIPKEKATDLIAKIKDSNLGVFTRKLRDVPKNKNVFLNLKDNFTNGFHRFNNDVQESERHVHSFRDVLAGTFLGNAILNGTYAIGNGIKGLIATGYQYDKEQQTMIASWRTLTGSAAEGQKMVNMTNQLAISAQNATSMVNDLNQRFYAVTNNAEKTRELSKSVLTLQDAFHASDAAIENFSTQWAQMVGNGKASAQDMLSIQNVFPKFRQELLKYEQQIHHSKNMTMADLNDMMSAGKISSNEMNTVLIRMGHEYQDATKNFTTTIDGMTRTIKATVPVLSGALIKPFTKTESPVYAAVSKWVTDKKTSAEFNKLGRIASQGMAKVVQAFAGGHVGTSQIERELDGMVIGLGQKIRTLTDIIAKNAGNIKATFSIVGSVIKIFAEAAGAAIMDVARVFGIFGSSAKNSASPLQAIANLLKGVANNKAAIQALGVVMLSVFTVNKYVAFIKWIKDLKEAMTFSATIKGVKLLGSALGSMAGAGVKALGGLISGTKELTVANAALDIALSPITLWVTVIAAIGVGFYEAYKHSKTFREGVDRLGASLKRASTGKAQWEKDLGRQFKNLNRAFDNDAKAFQKKLRKWNTDLWNGMTGNAKWEKDLRKKLDSAKKDYDRYSKQQLKSDQMMQRERQKNWNNFWSGLSKKSRSAWNDMSKHASNGMQSLRSTIAKHSSSVSKTWDNTWSTMKKITVGAWQVIRQHSSNGMETVRGAISSGMSRVSSIWNSGWNSMANFFKGIWSGIKQAAADGMNGVINVINAAIGGINKVWSFFTGHGTGLSNIGHVHFAQGGVVRRHLSVINDGDGPDWKELVQTPDGGLYMSQERNWTGFLPEGTRVYSGPETRQIMNAVGVSHYASGGIVGDIGEGIDWAKGSLENLGSWLGDKFSALEDFLADPLKATKGLLEKATNGLYNGLGHYADLAHGAMDKLTQPIADWFKKGLEKLEAQFESGGASPDLIRAAAAKMHVSISEADISHIMNVIQHESGGRANAVNNWDSNAAKGTPSKGILQFIEPTFMSYAMPGHTNILSPFDQLLAMFNDTTWRSDLTLGGWGPTGGRRYALGGEVFGLTNAIIGDNPQHHEFVLNPYAPSAEPLLDRAFEATADAQPSGQSGQAGNSKLDRMIELLEILVANVEGLDLNVSLDGEAIRRYNNKENAKEWQLRKG